MFYQARSSIVSDSSFNHPQLRHSEGKNTKLHQQTHHSLCRRIKNGHRVLQNIDDKKYCTQNHSGCKHAPKGPQQSLSKTPLRLPVQISHPYWVQLSPTSQEKLVAETPACPGVRPPSSGTDPPDAWGQTSQTPQLWDQVSRPHILDPSSQTPAKSGVQSNPLVWAQ